MGGDNPEPRRYASDIMLGLCFTLFGIAMGQQLTTISGPPFDWTFGGGRILGIVASTQRFDFWNILEFWYLVATVAFVGSSVLFLAFFTLGYFRKEPLNTSRLRSLFRQILYLTLAGLFPYVALHIGRLLLTYIPKVDPEYCREVVFLGASGCTNPEVLSRPEWTFQATPIPPDALATAPYSLGILVVYLVIMVILSGRFPLFQRKTKIATSEPTSVAKV